MAACLPANLVLIDPAAIDTTIARERTVFIGEAPFPINGADYVPDSGAVGSQSPPPAAPIDERASIADGLQAAARWVTAALDSVSVYTAAAYAVGLMLMLTRVFVGLSIGHRLRRASIPISDPATLDFMRRHVARLALRVVPAVAWCSRISVPVAVGVLRPMILLPTSLATGLTGRQLEYVLLHELAHIQRYDLIANLLERLIEVLLFFHPAVWWLTRQVRIERENACDDAVLHSGCQRAAYAEALLRVAELCAFAPSPTFSPAGLLAATGENPSQLARRIHRLFNVEEPSRARSAAPTVAMLLLFGASVILAMAAWRSPAIAQLAENPIPEPQRDAAESPDGLPNKNSPVTAAQIRGALLESAAKLVDLKITVVERGDFTERTPDRPVRVVFKEMWLHGKSAQVRADVRRDGNGDEWWTGFESLKGPITSADLATTPGVKQCVDMSRDMVSADSRPMRRPGPGGEIRTLHSLNKAPSLISNLFVPLVELDKPWIPPGHLGGSPLVNQIARLPRSAWHLLGEDKLGDEEVIRAEIHKQDTVKIRLQRHEGELALTPMYLAWFAKNRGMMPVRIESSMRYGFHGRDYMLEPGPDGQAPLVCEASDFIQFKGVWVPRVGRECTYRNKERDDKGFDPDALVDRIVAEGAIRMTGELDIGRSKEWRILDIEPIDPSVNLWFEPQDGAEVVDMETHHRFVQGDAVASAKFAARENAIAALVGQPAPNFPEGATWLNGEPLSWEALRGKVVILDFWADSCGPCRNDLPQLRELHGDRQKNGLAIIGVHLAGSELADVKKAVSDLQLEYPICVDVPIHGEAKAGELKTFPSEFTSKFAIDGIPHFVVVDRQGVVAASLVNRFDDALAIAQRLAKAAD
jgi:beta-lactamase regulating signal transducer with metallopeptidase domain/thiol-disulfide isomerase/thioredoxin